jgi:hypothetical protein
VADREELPDLTPGGREKAELPDLRGWGGLRSTKKAIRRSATVMANREAIAYEMLAMASTKITDIISWDEKGIVTVLPSRKVDHRHARMIRKVTSRTTTSGSGENQSVTQVVEVELYDKPAILRLLAQASGMLARDAEDDKPSVVGMKVVGPKKRKPRTIEGKG